jgi:hypothetical protein
LGILGVIAMPFGFDAECWRQMGYGIEWMDCVALWVASLPGLRLTLTAVICTIAAWGRGSRATRPAASASSPMVLASRMR